MPSEYPRALLEVRYYAAAQEYLRKLPLDQVMEATTQATQRKITLESLDLVHARRPEVQVFNELLVQYPLPRRKRPGQVVPDNMVVVHSEPIKAEGSFDTPLQPVGPFWVLEYVSKSNRRKDYDDNIRKYEHELKVPYYSLFVPDEQELTLYRYVEGRYTSVVPDAEQLYALPELDLELGLHNGWLRFWHKGVLLPLPADLEREVNQLRLQLTETREELTETREELTETREELTEAREELTETRQQLEASRQQQLLSDRRVEAAENELAQLRALLKQAQAKPPEMP